MKHVAFIGRWCPLHKGHKNIIKKIYKEKNLPVLIMVRDSEDEISLPNRINIIKSWLSEENITGEVIAIPDIEGIYYGRGVGYNIQEVIVEEDIKNISGTEIRDALKNKNYEKVIQFVDEHYTDAEKELIFKQLKQLGYIN